MDIFTLGGHPLHDLQADFRFGRNRGSRGHIGRQCSIQKCQRSYEGTAKKRSVMGRIHVFLPASVKRRRHLCLGNIIAAKTMPAREAEAASESVPASPALKRGTAAVRLHHYG
ncbi:hypothetical protein U8C36_32115 (plasmid) [Sinorhizobium medicae]|uniref:hypothetical protein n=1 Tax=Sinorhizobium medicae TaxID=110321 RepID=UPI002AF6A103|nr:hypothetical protein [Sinorhizobium medicae]WQO55467.1 hypothetical protein U8C36_32115 [Sinorhizobium medicae]